MRKIHISLLGIVLMSFMLALSGCTKSSEIKKHDKIEIQTPWIRATPPIAKTSAAYMVLQNRGVQEDRLIAVQTPISEVAELHTVVKEGDMMSMRPVKYIAISPHGTTKIKPGGFHIMLVNLKKTPKVGEQIPLTLKFQNAGEIKVMASVKEKQPGEDENQMKHETHQMNSMD